MRVSNFWPRQALLLGNLFEFPEKSDRSINAQKVATVTHAKYPASRVLTRQICCCLEAKFNVQRPRREVVFRIYLVRVGKHAVYPRASPTAMRQRCNGRATLFMARVVQLRYARSVGSRFRSFLFSLHENNPANA